MRNAVVIEGDIPAEYIKGSKKYKRLPSLKEYLNYVKKMPKQALKGAGKLGAGIGLLGAAGTGAYNLVKKDDK